MSTKLAAVMLGVTTAIASIGCGVEPEAIESLRDVVQTVSTPSSRNAPEPLNGLADDDSSDAASGSFDPPHPDRVDPFSFATSFATKSPVAETIRSAAHVQVMGFANVNEPRVFVKLKETIHSLRAGDTIDGIQVVSIREPAVELRMGALVWTATMFDAARSQH